MLRIYLDWNVFSNLKRDEFAKLKQYLTDASKDVLIFYTPAHFSDLMKSAEKGNPYFEQDLDTLTNFCGDHFIRWDVAKGMQVAHCLPRDFLPLAQELLVLIKQVTTSGNVSDDHPLIAKHKEISARRFQEHLLSTDDHNVRALIKQVFPGIGDYPTFADLYEAIPSFIDHSFHDKNWYKDFRAKFQESGMKLGQQAGNWKEEEVIENINTFLASQGAGIDFAGMQDQQEKLTGVKRSFYDKMISSYHMLDLFGYKADKLPKETDSMNNIAMDAEHAFYAAHTDIFVVGDKKLAVKAKVLYHYFDVDTLVVDPFDFQGRFTEILSSKQSQLTLDQASLGALISNSKKVESTVQHGPPIVHASALKLSQRAFGLFSHLVCMTSDDRPGAILQFKLAHKQKSSFLFASELEHLTKELTATFTLSEKPKHQLHEFLVEQPPGKELSWTYAECYWTLKKSEDGFPILTVGTLSNEIKKLVEAK